MAIICEHNINYSFNYDPFGENRTPTDEQIKEYKLYKCKACNKWYSLIGIIKGE